MIINLDPIEVVFDKVVTDLNITEHDVVSFYVDDYYKVKKHSKEI